jgi:hypothetical protein
VTTVLVVVETADDAFLGTVEEVGISTPDHTLILRNGFRGHPRYIPIREVERITRADKHPNVVFLNTPSPV